MIEILKPDFVHDDDRGSLVQLVHGGYDQVNAVFTKKGTVRGNFHYHKTNDEVFYIMSGKVNVTVRQSDETQKFSFKKGDMFRINAGVRHSFEYIEDTYLVVLYTGGVELPDGTKDIYTD
ncbi:MAG: cupin domain-containing protein [Clostridia bacterium]|nr:cupin domain-containing protein [Clostridia bacterium]